jgi:Fur family transcriptional regulator, ferric uptake regulator
MNTQVEKIQAVLVQHGYRLTIARQAIIAALVGCEGHITADGLARHVRENTPEVGRMTVYRTLDLLCELGIVRPIYQGTGAAHFVLMANGGHQHLICTRCHGVIEFDDCLTTGMAQQLADQFNFHVSGHLLELHGLCENCYR